MKNLIFIIFLSFFPWISMGQGDVPEKPDTLKELSTSQREARGSKNVQEARPQEAKSQNAKSQNARPPEARPPEAQSQESATESNGSTRADDSSSRGGARKAKAQYNMSGAYPEDITNENFPDIIDSFDFQDADLIEVIKAMNKLTGKNIILNSKKIRGKITILAPSQITVAEAYKAFLSALAMNGLTVVPSGKFLKIMLAKDAKENSIETYTDYFPNTDQMITRIIRLKYISASEVKKELGRLKSRSGDMQAYGPTNSIIITDYGSNIERVSGILSLLDVPGFEEQLAVIRIKNAKAKDIASIIDKIINKGKSGKRKSPVRRFNRVESKNSGKSGAESYSLVVPDDRSNAIIVMGNTAGIKRIRELVKKLDFPLNPDDSGGVYVYYVRHVEAKNVATVLSGIASGGGPSRRGGGRGPPRPGPRDGGGGSYSGGGAAAIFGGDVKISADEVTNSLVITASKQDYAIVKNLLSKLDIARDQVFVKTIIMEMNAQKGTNWSLNYFNFLRTSGGLGQVAFNSEDLASAFGNPLLGAGAILAFASGESFDLTAPTGGTFNIPSLLSLVNFIKSHVGGNVLSQPQIMAVDNEEAIIEVGQQVPVGITNNSSAGGILQQSIERKDATIKLIITPFISPDTDSVMMNIEQNVIQVAKDRVQASELAKAAIILKKRSIKTSIVVDSGNTAVLGGLMQEEETESVTKVPLLGDIPILGWLFKSRQIDKVKKNLLVFITPQVIRTAKDSLDLLNQKLDERIDFIKNNPQTRVLGSEVIDELKAGADKRNGNFIGEGEEDLEGDDFSDEGSIGDGEDSFLDTPESDQF